MVVGQDTRYDLPWPEIEKIKRRLELKNRLMEEGMRKRYDPFLQLKNVRFSDPAINRLMDLRKRGRQPGAPFKPAIFYRLLSLIVVPNVILYYLVRKEQLRTETGRASGDIPYEDRSFKSISGLPVA